MFADALKFEECHLIYFHLEKIVCPSLSVSLIILKLSPFHAYKIVGVHILLQILYFYFKVVCHQSQKHN